MEDVGIVILHGFFQGACSRNVLATLGFALFALMAPSIDHSRNLHQEFTFVVDLITRVVLGRVDDLERWWVIVYVSTYCWLLNPSGRLPNQPEW